MLYCLQEGKPTANLLTFFRWPANVALRWNWTPAGAFNKRRQENLKPVSILSPQVNPERQIPESQSIKARAWVAIQHPNTSAFDGIQSCWRLGNFGEKSEYPNRPRRNK